MADEAISVAQSSPASRFGPLRHREFAMLWGGLLVSNSGTWMQNVAQGWLTYALTNSPLALGLLGASFAIPMILLPLVGGTIADRVDRLIILRVTQTVMLLCAVVLSALTLEHVVTVWHMIALSFVSSVALAVDNPTRQALIPDLVPRSDLLGAISLNSVAFNGAALIGPAVAGLILKAYGDQTVGDGLYASASLVFFFNAVSFLGVLIPVFIIRRRPVERAGASRGFRSAMVEGLAYVGKRPTLMMLLALSAITSIFGRSFSQLLPVFARDVLNVGSDGFGLMLALPGLGTLIAGFTLAATGQRLDRKQLIVGGLVGVFATLVGFAASRSFPTSLLLLGLSGFFATVFGSVAATILQSETEGYLRGRVMSLYAITLIGLGPLGSLLSATLATYVPIGYAIALPSVAILIALGYAMTRSAWQNVR